MKKILIANRGEIAGRISQACTALGLESVAVHTGEDADALHVELADEAVCLRDGAARTPYLDAAALVDAALSVGADAVHPGYGFLSESADFAREVEAAGIVFIGPRPDTLAMLGDKVAARSAAMAAGVPVVPGSDAPVDGVSEVVDFGRRHGWPLVVKAALGGGGRGMRVIRSEGEAQAALAAAAREAKAAFGDDALFLERYIESARHVEVQMAADQHGNVVAVGDRDCSVQRRHQKLVEEAPAPGLSDPVREGIAAAATRLFRESGYRGLGTVEFLVDGDDYWFLEVNARIQVEHPVTELVTGVDLVAEQILIAAGEPLSLTVTPEPRGHAIEVRVNAEDPRQGFVPVPGRLERVDVPHRVGVRFDSGYRAGDAVTASFDSMIGKLLVLAPDRAQAIRRLLRTIEETEISGVPTTLDAASLVAGRPEFLAGAVTTRWFETEVEPLLGAVTPDAPSGPVVDDGCVEVAGRLVRIPRPAGSPAPRRPARVRTDGGDRVREHEGDVCTPMTGTVLAVHVGTGDAVRVGEALVTLESMKMENVVRAVSEGTVESVEVEAGGNVEAGDVLVRLHPPSA